LSDGNEGRLSIRPESAVRSRGFRICLLSPRLMLCKQVRMMIKDLLVNVAIGVDDDGTLDYALGLAGAFDAHAAGIAFAYEAVPPAMLIDDVPPLWIDEFRKEAAEAAKAAVGRFDAAARRAGRTVEARWMAASFVGTADVFGRLARRFDLSVVRQAEPGNNTPAALIIEAALFETGRPVVIVPYIHKAGVKLDRIMVCWDGGRCAARAVNDAMPFLARAGTVEVVMVTERGKSDEVPGADLARHLARHGVKVAVKQIVAPDAKPADVLLSHASDSGADFLVMGGFGHSRLREFVLGGVTRSILDTMTVPTLMAH
jgi:nucleotide-binding universal stress UspA family protein